MDPADDPFAESLPKPKLKKSLFKRQAKSIPKAPPAAAVADSESPLAEKEDDDDDLDLFKRSKDFFPVVLKDQDAEFEEERRKSTEQAEAVSHDRKRQRLSQSEESDSDIYDASPRRSPRRSPRAGGSISSRLSNHDRPLTPPLSKGNRSTPGSSRRSSARLNKGKGLAAPYSLTTPSKCTTGGQATASDAIILSDSEDDDGSPRKVATSALHRETISLESSGEYAPASRVDDSVDDLEEVAPAEEPEDEFAHFVAAAQERAAARKAEAARKAASAAAADVAGESPGDSSTPDGSSTPSEGEGSNIKVLITSLLPGPPIQPIVIRCLLSRKIEMVRDAFISFAPTKGRKLTPLERDTLFLTWKGRKVYNSATFLSLGIMPKNGISRTPRDRGVSADRDSLRQNSGFVRDDMIQMEVWTEEAYEAWCKRQQKKRLRDLGEVVSDDEDDERERRSGGGGGHGSAGAGADGDNHRDTGEGQEANAKKIRIVLKSKDLEPLKVTSYPSTTVSVLVSAFRKQRNVPPEKDVQLFWDGDKLAEDATIAEAEIEDLETVEVHIK